MKFLYVLATLLCTAGFSPAVAQVSEGSRAEVALGYTYLHSNAPPSGCGCFSWNGGLVSAAWHFNSKLSLAGEFGGAHASKLASSSLSPTITTFLAGPRYTFGVRHPRIAPFAQILLGGAHSIGGYYPSGATSSGTATGFAMTAGGGFDLPLSRHLILRPIQAEYLMTRLPNGVNDRQNNIRITTGVAVRFGAR